MKTGWLLATPTTANDRAFLYLLVISCKRLGKDPPAYLRDLLTRLPRMSNQHNLDALLS